MRYVALLRGINVGGNKKVEMKKLKSVFESLGFKNVSTYINSGNVLFETKGGSVGKITDYIEKELGDVFGFKIQILIRSADDVARLVGAIPETWVNDTNQRTDVLFLWDTFNNKESIDLIKKTEGIDNLKYVSGAIVWNLDKKFYAKSGMHKFIGTIVYKNMTARNINTVRKLAELLRDK